MKKQFLKKSLLAMVLSTAFMAMAQADEQTIRNTLKDITPNAAEAKITPSVIPGLYQVVLGTRVLLMDDKARYVFSGDLIDLKTRKNLTTAAENKQRKSILDSLDESKMIVYPAKGATKRTITVFSDIDCPYCKKLHDDIPKLTAAGIKVRYLSFPRAGVGSGSYKKAVAVWCSSDRRKALDKVMMGVAVDMKTCANPVMNDMKLAELFGVNGTPNILLDDGELIPGYVESKDLIQKLVGPH
ncbi:DsbC family protein [Hydrogenovibrio marinus]|uniref:Thiol:disulfide interchange protein n=1 Tax=Hydrogenovibrio marinus TaxID=28885 RepID=A0A066ZP11_HYDMR|nr:DsbC family protein [Hydrogenovibrio marinus]KDN95558.1 thiol:disulfide interchange protein DsbC [Hydrogenovibrio marinus]BBN60052.1 thiol:disulfide interchange protein DsbC [Hydrogenovibrio marinus]